MKGGDDVQQGLALGEQRVAVAENCMAMPLKLLSVSITPLGEPVVPPVCTTTQACSGS